MTTPRHLPALGVLTFAAVMFAGATPANAQDAPNEEITVIGNYERAPDGARSLSQAVSYADLDLSTQWGWDELHHRIRLTARYLCDKLGEPRFAMSPATKSCSDQAAQDAFHRLGTSAELRAPRGTTWVAGPAWAPPYPGSWVD